MQTKLASWGPKLKSTHRRRGDNAQTAGQGARQVGGMLQRPVDQHGMVTMRSTQVRRNGSCAEKSRWRCQNSA